MTNTTASIDLAQLDKLEALTNAATPGPWMRLFGERTVYDRMEDGCRGNTIVRADVGYSSLDADNLDFIAAANPATMQQLIALARRSLTSGAPAEPVDMILHCPKCGKQHVDTPEHAGVNHDDGSASIWDNPPHRSHLCHGCGHIWRPADVPTNGVKAIATKGANDSPVHDTATPSAAQASVDWIYSVLRDVGELDYDSPEDQPDLMMVTTDELFTIIRRHAPSAGAAAKTEQAPFRERFADAYKSLSVAHFNGPFWNQGMEELLVAVDAEINKRVAERTAAGAGSAQLARQQQAAPHAQAEPVAGAPSDAQRIRDEVDWENGLTQLLEGYKHATDYGICSRESVQARINAYILAAPAPQEAEQAAPAAVTALSDADVVAVLASLGIDAEPSKYGFDTLQVHTTVPAIRDIVGAYLEFQPAAPAVTDAARDVLADAKGGAA